MYDISIGQPQRTQALGQLALQQGAQAGPIYHPMQALGQLAQTAVGVYLMNRADDQQKQRQEQANSALLALMGGTPAPPMAMAGATPMPMGGGGAGTVMAGGTSMPTPSGGPDLSALMSRALQYPELAPFIGPMMQAQMAPPKDPKLVEIADADSPTGTRLVPAREAVGQPGRPRQQWRFETITGPDGQTRTIMVQGRPGSVEAAEQVTKPTRNKLEQGIATATTQLDRLRQIRENFDTRFLNLPEQFKQGGRALLERMGVELSPEAQQDLSDYTAFATSTRRNLNRVLNELSGAAISPAEAKRLLAELPNIKDSPTQFMAKLADAERSIQAAITRNQQLLESGVMSLQFDKEGNVTNAPPLENFMAVPEERGVIEAGMGGGGGEPAPPASDFGATAVNPETGEVVIWNGTEWVPQ